MKTPVVLAVISGYCCLISFGATNYVDRAIGNDDYNGTTPATAKRTIQAAVDIANPGDTVLVAPGIYDEGMTVTPGSTGWLSNRVVITKDILLESTHGAQETIILGARDPSSSVFEGCGSNAVRCVYANAGTLRGFTLAGGASGDVSTRRTRTTAAAGSTRRIRTGCPSSMIALSATTRPSAGAAHTAAPSTAAWSPTTVPKGTVAVPARRFCMTA
jgi:hypothetical protein